MTDDLRAKAWKAALQERNRPLEEYARRRADEIVREAPVDVKLSVYIPSRGRAGIETSSSLLTACETDYKIVVEPRERDAYLEIYGDRVLVMDENDMGIGYSRQFILEHARSAGHLYHWQMDDNIVYLERRSATTKPERVVVGRAMAVLEKIVQEFPNVAGANFQAKAYAFGQQHRSLRFNAITSCCMIYRDVGIDISVEAPGTEDTDYSLKMLFAGHCTITLTRFAYEKVPYWQRTGGCHDSLYAGDGKFHHYATVWKDGKVWWYIDGKKTDITIEWWQKNKKERTK